MKLAITNIVLILFSYSVSGQTLTLKQCIDSAFSNNTHLAIAENNQTLSNLKYKEIQSNLLPKISVNGEYKYFLELPYQLLPLSVFGGPAGQFKEAQFGVPHNIQANVTLQVPIYSSQIIGNINKLKTSQSIIALEIQKSYDQIYFEISNIYRNAQLLKGQITFIDSTIINTQRLKYTIDLLVDEKLANQNDAKKIQLKLSKLNTYRSTLEIHLKQLYNGLQLIMGITSAFEVEDHIKMIDLVNYDENGNRDVDIIKFQQEIVTLDLKSLKRTKYIPEIRFIATYGTQGYGYDESPNRFLNFYPIGYAGVRLSYTLFNGTVTNKRIHQKNIELENLVLKEKLLLDSKKVEIENTLLKLENALNNVELSEKQVKLAQSIYSQEEIKYRMGLVSINDLLLAQNELIQNQQNYLLRIAEFLSADLELKKLSNNISNK